MRITTMSMYAAVSMKVVDLGVAAAAHPNLVSPTCWRTRDFGRRPDLKSVSRTDSSIEDDRAVEGHLPEAFLGKKLLQRSLLLARSSFAGAGLIEGKRSRRLSNFEIRN
jgi:hypothetical protein